MSCRRAHHPPKITSKGKKAQERAETEKENRAKRRVGQFASSRVQPVGATSS